MSWCCTACGRPIFSETAILGRRELWDLGEYKAPVFLVSSLLDPQGLRRYDVSLHQGWYCCRFIAMRMVVDKFGTGDSLLVYADSVAPGPLPTLTPAHQAPRLSARDFDSVVQTDRGRLTVVKLGASWCPPCRLVDQVFDRVITQARLPEVDLFDVDVDETPGILERWPVQSIPFTRFWLRGRPVELRGPGTAAGGLIGGHGQAAFEGICTRLLAG